MNNFLLWLRIIRPQTLFASVCPVVVTWIVMPQPVASWTVAVVTLLCAIALQVLSNLVNDLYDYLRGTDQQGRVGFRRALAEGEVTKHQMLVACGIDVALCLALGAYLVWTGGWVILLIGLTALLFAWLYTATSHSLSYLGIADVFVFLYYGVVASAGTYYLLTAAWSWPVFWAGAVCGLISMCVLLINNLRDIDDDRRVGKRTLPVRLGRRAALGLMLAVVLCMPVAAWLAFGWSLPVAIVVPALLLWRAVTRAEGAAHNRLLMMTGLLNVLYVLCAAFAAVW